ncbi:MAG: 50S ribosomal protein L20, partial [Candidatus Kapaibacterium sp.]
TYSRLIDALNKKGLDINRKVLADLAYSQPDVFKSIVEHVR